MIVDPFAGPGGWSQGLRLLGLADVGIELDPWACATRAAAGHATIRADVATFPLSHLVGLVWGLIMSPPCKALSKAGKRHALPLVPALVAAIGRRDWSARPHEDPLVWLVLEVGRWVEALRPSWIALEQVPEAMPLWRAYEQMLIEDGYSVATGVLSAEQYGVPQVRERAVLIASNERAVALPEPTHAAYQRKGRRPRPGLSLFGELPPPVSMGEALGWDGAIDRRTNSKGPGWRSGNGSMVPTALVPTDRPAPTVLVPGAYADGRPKGNRVPRATSDPAPTLAFGHDFPSWCWERPSTTVCDTRISAPGHKDEHRRQKDDCVQVEIWEAGVLQSFPADYPWRGGKGARAEQVGNAVPPLLAMHVLSVATGIAVPDLAAA